MKILNWFDKAIKFVFSRRIGNFKCYKNCMECESIETRLDFRYIEIKDRIKYIYM